MEQQKDNQRGNITDRVIDTMHQQSATQRTDQRHNADNINRNMNNLQRSNPGSRGFDYVVRKSEKLTTALYLVTDIMSEKEPMKWKARESAVELLSDITIASSLPVSEKMTMLRNVMKRVEKVIAFLDIAQSAHLVSEMNASVLKREYLALKDSLEAEWNHVYEKSRSIFADSFFDVPHDVVRDLPPADSIRAAAPPAVVAEHQQQNIPARSLPQQAERPNPAAPRLNVPTPVARPFINRDTATLVPSESGPLPVAAEKKELMIKIPHQVNVPIVKSNTAIGQNPQPTRSESSQRMSAMSAPATAVKDNELFSRAGKETGRGDRRKIILTLIKQKPSLTVKDIGKSIPHVSEKTIQRELLFMVFEGVLEKRGERRWSTYSLRNQ